MNDELPEVEASEPDGFHDKMVKLLQEWINEGEDQPVLIDVAVVVWEQMTYNGDGDVIRKVNYSTLTLNAGLASTAGLLDLGRDVLSQDLFDGDDDGEA